MIVWWCRGAAVLSGVCSCVCCVGCIRSPCLGLVVLLTLLSTWCSLCDFLKFLPRRPTGWGARPRCLARALLPLVSVVCSAAWCRFLGRPPWAALFLLTPAVTDEVTACLLYMDESAAVAVSTAAPFGKVLADVGWWRVRICFVCECAFLSSVAPFVPIPVDTIPFFLISPLEWVMVVAVEIVVRVDGLSLCYC